MQGILLPKHSKFKKNEEILHFLIEKFGHIKKK